MMLFPKKHKNRHQYYFLFVNKAKYKSLLLKKVEKKNPSISQTRSTPKREEITCTCLERTQQHTYICSTYLLVVF